MNIGIRLHDTAPGSLEERLAFARAQGFSCAHLALSKTLDDFTMDKACEEMDDNLAARVKSAFAQQSLQCAVLGCYLSLAQPDLTERAQIQAIYQKHLQFAPQIDAFVVGTETPAAPGHPFSEPVWQSEEAFELFLESLIPVVRFAEEHGAILAIEPVHDHIVSTPERAQRMLERVHSDHLRIILDAVNLISPETATAGKADALIEEAIARLGDQIMILHMKDYVVVPGKPKVSSLACGKGQMHYETLLRFAKEKNIPMTLEDTKPDNAEAARLHLENVAQTL